MKPTSAFISGLALACVATGAALAKERVLVLTDISNEPDDEGASEHFQHDFAARMDWCVADDFKKANHNPIAVLNGDTSKRVVELTAKPGETVTLSAAGSTDPDGDAFTVSWFIYREAGAFPGEVKLSATSGDSTSFVVPAPGAKAPKPPTLHVILQTEDRGTPSLFAYRRAIITVQP